jgi:hypothetical protein
MKRIILILSLLSISSVFSQSSYRINSANYNIPDGSSSSNAGTAVSSVTFSGLPSNSTITNVAYETIVNHSYHGDLAGVISTNSSGTVDPRIVLYTSGSLGNASGNLIRNGTTHEFDGLNPNQTFYFRVWDTASGDTGYIDYFKITVYYTTPTAAPTAAPAPPVKILKTALRARIISIFIIICSSSISTSLAICLNACL